MMKKIMITAVAVLFMGALTASACDNTTKASVKADGEQVTMSGKLVCLGCTLAKTAGAKSSCKVDGCSHAIMTKDGSYINLLQNKESKTLLTGENGHNKPVTVTGVYFANANVIDVQTFAVDGGKDMSWCGGCKKMDACASR
ncbi:MAG: hypothetical protein GY867_04265 [bacterium]|nr:hypothetical protein [bacterium]